MAFCDPSLTCFPPVGLFWNKLLGTLVLTATENWCTIERKNQGKVKTNLKKQTHLPVDIELSHIQLLGRKIIYGIMGTVAEHFTDQGSFLKGVGVDLLLPLGH